MHVSLTDAKAQLTELVRLAEAGEEITLTRHGRPAVRLVAVKSVPSVEFRRRLVGELQHLAAGKATSGPGAARGQDFLYDENGLPG